MPVLSQSTSIAQCKCTYMAIQCNNSKKKGGSLYTQAFLYPDDEPTSIRTRYSATGKSPFSMVRGSFECKNVDATKLDLYLGVVRGESADPLGARMLGIKTVASKKKGASPATELKLIVSATSTPDVYEFGNSDKDKFRFEYEGGKESGVSLALFEKRDDVYVRVSNLLGRLSLVRTYTNFIPFLSAVCLTERATPLSKEEYHQTLAEMKAENKKGKEMKSAPKKRAGKKRKAANRKQLVISTKRLKPNDDATSEVSVTSTPFTVNSTGAESSTFSHLSDVSGSWNVCRRLDFGTTQPPEDDISSFMCLSPLPGDEELDWFV